MFSLHDGNTKIERQSNGSVLVHLKLCCDSVQTIHFTSDEWCSAVASVAKNADASETHEAVRKLHVG